jgi:lantibiotic biosynthesis protein
MSNIPYKFHPGLVMRTPRFPLHTNIGNLSLQQLAGDAVFMEALFLASPVLHAELQKFVQGKGGSEKEEKKLLRSVAKYYLRMSSRCTPFGLFSGCAVAQWSDGDTTRLVLDDQPAERHTRFDMHYLCALAQHLAKLPCIKDRLLYYPNTGYYKIGDEVRYVEYKYVNARRHHIISSVSASDYVMQLLQAAAQGILLSDMVQLLVTDEIEEQEAIDFISEMIEAQLLTNELEPAITGDEFLHQIIGTLQRINQPEDADITAIIQRLQQTDALIAQIDQGGNHQVEAYYHIMETIRPFEVAFEESKLFQTDISFPLREHKVDAAIQAQLLEGLTLVNRLNKAQENANLSAFAKRFYERYEDKEMPLLEVLDTETGIGYLEQYNSDIVPLVDDMFLPRGNEEDNRIPWNRREQFLLRKLQGALSQNALSVELTEADLADFDNDWQSLPPSVVSMFRLLPNGRLLLESAGGSSAANLLGRFAHGNQAIHQIINEIVAEEDAQNPGVVFAEIIHLPESRIGNILLHPAFRKYEIPFLAKASVDTEHQVLLQDLYITVRNNKVKLHSKRLGRQVIPRLSTAHNYSNNALPVYQFLCDLQLQDKQSGIGFHWGALEGSQQFLPRVTYKDIVLFAAQWSFLQADIAPMADKEGDALLEAAAAFREKFRLPALAVLADGDNELLVNFEDALMLRVWLDAVKKRPGFLMKEFLGAEGESMVKDAAGRGYTNQFIAPLIKTGPCYGAEWRANDSPPEAEGVFLPGSEWLYYKIYCGLKSSDRILAEAVHPLVTQLLVDGLIDQFFFIRYNDPGFHLRIRFHVPDTAHIGQVMQMFHRQILPFETAGYIAKTQMDTYKRELDRYGHNSIELAERFFYHDSMACLQMLELTFGDEREEVRWIWALRAIDELLNAFAFPLPEKLSLLEKMKDSFYAEFRADKMLKNQLSAKYRAHKSRITAALEGVGPAANDLEPLWQVLRQKTADLAPVVQGLQQLQQAGALRVSLNELMPSYIHMLVNRIITSNPRLHELVLYDMLFTWYRSVTEKNKQQAKNKTVQQSNTIES